jgi:SAM-dependent methyltransferase
MTTVNPFLDPAALPGLYDSSDRLARRTRALHHAKISGRHAADVIAELAAASVLPGQPVIADIGCGRGTTTLTLAARLPAARLLAIDASAALLTTFRGRAAACAGRARSVCADFHALPLRDESCDLAVAAFCLYHSPHPDMVIGEIARCLAPGGSAILVTKSADSYRELDELLSGCDLDPDATSRRSLYEAAHSASLPGLVGDSALEDIGVWHDQHQFRFQGLGHLAEYLATSPKYALAPSLRDDPGELAAELRRRISDRPVEATSTITYVLGRRGGL